MLSNLVKKKLFAKRHRPLKYTGLWIAFMLLLGAIQAQPVANFTSDIQSGCAPLIVNFTNQSVGAVSYSWDLGNGGPLIDIQNPITTYFNPGNYTVKLTVRNAAGLADSIIKTNFITVLAPPQVNFIADDTVGCFKHQVQFTDQTIPSGGTISSWAWDFGDGRNSTLQNPSHTYSLTGDFTVNLTVRQSNGCAATFSRSRYIEVTTGIVADFFAPFPTGCKPPINIPLQNLTTGPGTLTYNWNFGNGSPNSNAINPTATYNNPGNYDITLVATSSEGCFDTVRKPIFIPSVSVSSSFTAPDTVCLGQPVSFQNTSSPDPDTSFWSFGDGTTSRALNPVKVFNTPGLFTVKMVNKFGICVDSFSKTIFIPTPPAVSFTSTNPISCSTSHSVTFTSNAPDAVNWVWNFGNGTGTGPSPTRIYADTGTYSVRLTVTTANGCTNSQLISNYVRISRPRVRILNLPDSGCLPFTLTPTITTYSIDGIQTYFWDFGDGFTTTTNTPTPPTHVYTVPGRYTFRLRAVTNGGCVDSVIIPNAVTVGTDPAVGADFSGSPLIACAGQPINFLDLSPNPLSITGWRWEFGDNLISSDRNPEHIYADTGRFDVSLTIFNNGCGATVLKDDYVTVFGAVARYNYTVDCSNKRRVSFRDSSLNAQTILWNFGDGSATSSLPNPTHVFPANGNYTVSLTVTNDGCTFVSQRVVEIVDEPASFLINPNPLCKGDRVTFSATGSIDTNLVRYEWDFGFGTYQTAPRTTQTTYAASGLFTTRLRITDVNGCRDSVSIPLPVGGPKAGLGAVNPTGCRGLTVNFIDSSRTDGVNGIITRIWDFGDGVIQTINTPPYQHTYNNTGSYSVKLKIIDAGGCTDSIRFVNFVTISEPKAAFSTVDSLICPGKRVQFINQTGGTINNFTWTFGDGTSSVLNNPSHIYTGVGNYSVKLKIRDRFGCEDSLTKTNFIVVDTPFANYTISDSLSSCPPLRVDFTFTGRYYKSLRWEFGDGGASDTLSPQKTYNLAGTYITRLIVTSPGGCTDTMQKTITILGPSATIAYNPLNGCDTLTVNFRSLNTTNVDSILWDFNDGNVVTRKDSVIAHKYTVPGFYLPSVILQDIYGCRVPLRGVDTIKVIGTTPAFVSSSRLFCDSGTVQFTDSTKSNGTITSWRWDFGDGSTSTLQNPSHLYTAPGNYAVKLTVGTDRGCFDSVTLNNYIKIVRSPVTDIVSSAVSACQLSSISFRGIEVIADTSALTWSWDFANGQTSTLQNPPVQQYITPGIFNVRMIVTNSSGCKDTADRPVTINPIPVVNAGPDSTICLGDAIQLNTTGATTYQWLPPVNNLSCTNCANPIATPTITTTYVVRGTTAFGCERNDTVTITVIQPSTVTASADDSLCIGQSTTLSASGTQVYSWTPATGLNNPNIANPIARPTTTTTYTVTGSDIYGCFTTTDTVLITVFPIPTVDAGPDTTISAGSSYQFGTQFTNDVQSFLWAPPTGLSCTTCPAPVTTPRISTTYTVTVANNGGCTSNDAVTVYVICNNENIFMPNTFSPNGDGMNDVYYPRGRGINTIRSLRIFTRWGQQVYARQNFNANEITAGWDGNFKGARLPADVYVYILELVCENQTIISLKGDITLVR